MNPDPLAARLEASYRNLDRVNMWIANVESKASASLAATAIILGLTVARIPAEMIPLFGAASTRERVQALLFTAYVVGFSLSAVRALLVFFPKVAGAHESLFFFGSIAKLEEAEFEMRMKSLETTAIETELIRQTHTNAQITSQKFRHFRWSMIFLITSLVSGGFFLLLKSSQLIGNPGGT